MENKGNPVNGVELQVFRHLFSSIAEEMGFCLMRSAYSSNIKDRRDYSCALFDAKGEMIAQAAHIPVHLGSTPMSVQAVFSAFQIEEMRSDDLFILNDPYSGGTHLPDITMVAPCFCQGEETPRFFVVNRAHHADIGGKSAGSMPLSTHIDEEGIRLLPQRYTQEVLATICEASRTPDERRGDLYAQVASLQVGRSRLLAACDRYGKEKVSFYAEALQDYSERMMRAILQKIPDGEYSFSDYIEEDGFGTEKIILSCSLSIRGEEAIVDFTKSASQVKGPLNAIRSIALSAVHYVFRCLGGVELPSNGGVMRPMTVLTRSGSVVDAQFPSPVAGGNVETSQRLVDVLLGALSFFLPDCIPAASCGSMNNLTVGGYDPIRCKPFAYYETLAGGAGASPVGEGASAIHTHMTNTRNTPVEVLEAAYPFRVLRYALRRASGGAGLHRGGNGILRAYFFLSFAELTLLTERRVLAPFGLAGGSSGAVGRHSLFRDGLFVPLAGKVSLCVESGDSLLIETPGGGGWGCLKEKMS